MTLAIETRPAVLVVEDDALIREIVCDMLEGASFDVVSVGSTQSALTVLDSGVRIDAAFVDVDLGDRGGGYIVARHARETRPDLTVIYTSGGPQENFARERVENSAFVPKPYLPSRVRALLEAAVREAELLPH